MPMKTREVWVEVFGIPAGRIQHHCTSSTGWITIFWSKEANSAEIHYRYGDSVSYPPIKIEFCPFCGIALEKPQWLMQK